MTCPALHILRGAMGVDEDGHPIEPQHRFTDIHDQPATRCAHCGSTPEENHV